MIDLKVIIFLIFRKSDYQRSKEEDNGERNNNKVSNNFMLKHIFVLPSTLSFIISPFVWVFSQEPLKLFKFYEKPTSQIFLDFCMKLPEHKVLKLT